MVKTSNFISAYYVTRQNKRRSADSVEFELHWERNIARLMSELADHSFAPTAYTFIASRPRPREVFACEMALRVVHHYIDMRLRPLLEEELTDRTYNNRIGYGGNEAVNQVISDIYEVSKGFTCDAWIIKMDLKGYFPNADQDIVYRQLSGLVERKYKGDDKDLLQYMIARSVYSFPARHCYRKSPLWKWQYIEPSKSLFRKPDGIGGAIGHLIWQNAMNYYLNDIDHYILDECGLKYVRFVDDMVIVTDNKECTLALVADIRKRLAALGCELHPSKFYCQHYTKGVEFIGSHIKLDRVYAGNRVIHNARRTIQKHNRNIKIRNIEHFLASMNSYLGIFKTRNEYGTIRNLLCEVSPEWKRYVSFDYRRKCFRANKGYTHREILSRKYNLKFKKHKNHDNDRTNSYVGVAPAGAA